MNYAHPELWMAKATVTAIKRPQRYLLRVELEYITPPIWRQISVDGQLTLDELHQVLQVAMGWTDSHLHEFIIHGVTYATPHPDDDRERKITDERQIKLERLFEPGMQFVYVYDFGDNWRHLVRVEKAEAVDASLGLATVLAGEHACPPEDCGGPHIYGEFLQNLKTDPKGSEVKDFMRWVGKDFRPKRFQLRAANAALQNMVWNSGGE